MYVVYKFSFNPTPPLVWISFNRKRCSILFSFPMKTFIYPFPSTCYISLDFLPTSYPPPLQEGEETSKFICLGSWRPCLQPFWLYNQDWKILSSKGLKQSEVEGGGVLSCNFIFFPNPNFLKSWFSSSKIPSPAPFPHMISFYLNQCCGSVLFWYGFWSVSWNNGSGFFYFFSIQNIFLQKIICFVIYGVNICVRYT